MNNNRTLTDAFNQARRRFCDRGGDSSKNAEALVFAGMRAFGEGWRGSSVIDRARDIAVAGLTTTVTIQETIIGAHEAKIAELEAKIEKL